MQPPRRIGYLVGAGGRGLFGFSGAGELAGPEADAVAALALGAVHGLVGVALEQGRVLAVGGIHGDPDAAGNGKSLAFNDDGILQACNQGFGDGLRGGVSGTIFDESEEFITADAGDGIGVADARTQASGDRSQQLVADVMAETVVDDLEGVEVDAEDGKELLAAGSAGQRLFQAVLGHRTVGQAGKRGGWGRSRPGVFLVAGGARPRPPAPGG